MEQTDIQSRQNADDKKSRRKTTISWNHALFVCAVPPRI
jgi:hypothetical protein